MDCLLDLDLLNVVTGISRRGSHILAMRRQQPEIQWQFDENLSGYIGKIQVPAIRKWRGSLISCRLVITIRVLELCSHTPTTICWLLLQMCKEVRRINLCPCKLTFTVFGCTKKLLYNRALSVNMVNMCLRCFQQKDAGNTRIKPQVRRWSRWARNEAFYRIQGYGHALSSHKRLHC